MKESFFQEILTQNLFKKFTTMFSFLEKDDLTELDLQKILEKLKEQGLITALENSKQKPEELSETILNAFDKAVEMTRERLMKNSSQVVNFIQKERFS